MPLALAGMHHLCLALVELAANSSNHPGCPRRPCLLVLEYNNSLYCVVEVTVMELTIISAPSVVDQTTTSARLAINESAYDVSRDLISSHDTVSSVSPLTPKA